MVDAITEALTASLVGALGDQLHLVEAAGGHEASHSEIKWKHLCTDALYLLSSFTRLKTFSRNTFIGSKRSEAN